MTSAHIRVLLVEDDDDDALLIRECLAEACFNGGTTFERASSVPEALLNVEAQPYDVLLIDYCLGADDGLSFLRQVRSKGIDTSAILLTNQGSQEVAVEAMKAGATDYLQKAKLAPGPLGAAVRHAVERQRSRSLQAQAEEALRTKTLELVESNRFNAEIIASVREAIFACDADLRFVLWNRFAEELSGIPAREPIGRRVLEVFPGLAAHGIEGLLRRVLAGEIVSTPEVPVGIPGTDKTIWTTGTLVPRRNAEGAIIGVIGAIHDITEHKRADDALGRSEDQLRQSQKMEAVGRLAGGIAHDFNNLLGVIMGYAELLLRGRDPDHPDVRRIEQIHKAAERAAGLTRQLLAFSRKQVLDPKVVSLNAIVEDTQKMLRRLIGEDVEVIVSLEPDLDLVKADPGQVEQVLMNLAVNARDAMPQGGRLVIETANVVLDEAYAQEQAGVRPGPHVMFAVSDTGVGMDAETRTRVFEPFFTTKELGKGTGLGLSTVYGIVQQSGGHITLYSEPGMGSTFKVYLRRVEEDATPARTEAPREPVAAGSETILLVEDEASLREMIGEILRDAGYTVIEAAGRAEALAVTQGHPNPVDLLLTDVVMPEMNGRELARALSLAWPLMKVLFMSGYTDDAIVQHGVLEPGIAFLGKPFTADALARKVRAVLDAAT